MSTQGLRAVVERIGLPAWFVVIDLLWLAKPDVLAVDARHYQRATDAWLSGGNPWAVTEFGINFAAAPHTLLFYVPTHFLPMIVSTWLWMTIGIVASVWVVRRLGLPLWWLLFPPLAHSMWNGNSQTIALALLLVTGPPVARAASAAVAVALKLYTGLALILRWRDLVVAGVVMAVLVLVVPWRQYLDSGLGIAVHLNTAWNGSAWRFPVLLVPTIGALWVLRRHGAEWLAVPAVWPATQFYYSAMALPALVGRPILAAAFALPMVLLPPITIMVMAAALLWQRHREDAPRLDGLVPRPASLEQALAQ
jgi:hypothetical protein